MVRTVQVDLDDRVELDFAHLVEEPVAQDAGVVDHPVDASERGQRAADDAFATLRGGDVVGVRHGAAAGGSDLVDHLLRRAGVEAFAGERSPDVVHHHCSACGRARQREVAADAAARAGDRDDLAVQHAHPCLLLRVLPHVNAGDRYVRADQRPGVAPWVQNPGSASPVSVRWRRRDTRRR